MKLLVPFLLSLSLASTASADENWIPITPVDKPQTSKQVRAVNKMIKNAAIIKQLIDTTGKKEVVKTKEKNWFVLGNEESK
ncbi:hypothetical protein [Sulfurimonas sp.]|uniref:hypothetical protein n=1 Tax=Sulfurimonas sp. TaxID=2022749 RepID=UPI001A02FDCE|nr:hypothetical protein [Sulfurimonas sp.]MBE0515166.1 hypothetical protein [Sulfurimonas sp.]